MLFPRNVAEKVVFNIALKLLRRGLFSHNRSQLVEEVCWAQVAFVENMHTPHPLVHGLWNLLIEGALDFEHQVLRQELFKTFPAPVDALRPGKSTYGCTGWGVWPGENS